MVGMSFSGRAGCEFLIGIEEPMLVRAVIVVPTLGVVSPVRVMVMAVAQFSVFARDYFGDYRVRSASWFQYNIRGGLDAIVERTAGGARPVIHATYTTLCDPGDRVVYPVPSWNNNHYVTMLAAKGVPHSLHVWGHGSIHDWPEWIKMASAYLPSAPACYRVFA